jgi:multidrug efflux pump subunit AcrA (membrane-fusion protein)
MNRLLVFLSLLALSPSGWGETVFSLPEIKPHVVQTHRTKEAGIVETVEVKVGDKVSPKQILLKLEHDRQLHAYLVAKAKADNEGALMVAEGDVEEKSANLEEVNMKFRRRQVSASQVTLAMGQLKTSRGRLEVARMNKKLADLEVALAEKMLERRFVRAALEGTVIEISRAPGERAGEGDIVVTVADINWMTAFIPLTKESAAALGKSAFIPIRMAGSSVTRVAQVIGTKPMPNATKGEQLVQITFSNPDPLTLPQKAFEVLLPQELKTVPIAKQAPAPAKPEPAKKTPGRT